MELKIYPPRLDLPLPESSGAPVLILLEATENETALLPLLDKIMEAVGRSREAHCLTISIKPSNTYSLGAAMTNYQFSHIISFGVNAAQLGLAVEQQLYFPFRLGSSQFLFGESLATIAENQASKRKLWNAMKPLFTE